MKILFTLLVVDAELVGHVDYIVASKKVIHSILKTPNCDVKVTTNVEHGFDDIIAQYPDRIILDYNSMEDHTVYYHNKQEFNFNLKHLVFDNIPPEYDVVFYLDSDNGITIDDEMLAYLDTFINSGNDVICSRSNATMEFERTHPETIYSHKFRLYTHVGIDDGMFDGAKIPSEHFLIFKNSPKVQKFGEYWGELCKYMEKEGNPHGAWGDGVEIGMAMFKGGMLNVQNEDNWVQLLNINFNENKI